MSYCEDYPACGHTPLDPCARQWYDEPGAFDTSVNPHALCEHEYGFCDVDEYEDDYEDDDGYDPEAEADAAYDAWLYAYQEHNPYGPDEDGLRESDFI